MHQGHLSPVHGCWYDALQLVSGFFEFFFAPLNMVLMMEAKIGISAQKYFDNVVQAPSVCSCQPSRKHQDSKKEEEKKKPHIKKPLNAFMLYMKEMRAKVVAECTLKESAAINQILGRRVGN